MKAKRQVQQQLKRDYRRYKRRVAGILGDYSGTVDVPNRVGYVFVRLRNQEVKEAFNKRVPSLVDLPVWVGYSDDPGEPQILQVLDTRTGVERQKGEDPIGLFIPAHHETHEWFNPLGGQDVVFSDKRQFMPFRPTPIGGMLLHVYRNVGWLNGEYTFFSGSSIDLSPYVPATGAYFGLVYEDTDATLSFSSGTGDFLKNAFTLTLSDIPNPIPGTYPIAAVRMWGGMTGIVEALDRTDLIDLRFPFTQNFLLLSDVPWSYTGSATKVVSVKSDEMGLEFTTVTAGGTGSAHIIQDEGTDLPAQPHLNFVGGGVAAVNDPVNSRTTVRIPGTVSVFDDGIFQVSGTALDFMDNLDVAVTGTHVFITGQAGGGETGTFIGLTDTPENYIGASGSLVTVKGDETGLEFTAGIDISSDSANIVGVNFLEQSSDLPIPGTNHRVLYAKSGGFYKRDDIGNVARIMEEGDSAGGDLTGTYPNPTVKAIQGKTVQSGTPSDNQILIWDSTNNRWEFGDQSGGGGGGSGALPVFDDSVFKVTGTAISFDTNLDVSITGSIVYVNAQGVSGDNTYSTPYASRPSPTNDGDLFFPNDGPYIERVTGTSSWLPWGPIFPMNPPINGDFSWINQGSATVDTSKGGIYLESLADAGRNRIRKKAAPTVPYTITVAFIANFPHTPDNVNMGLVFRQSSDGKLHVFGVAQNGGSAVPIFWSSKFTDPATFSAHYLLDDARLQFAPCIWLRIADNNTNRICSYSTDGQHFFDYHTVGRTDFLAADEVGFYVSTNDSSGNVGMWLLSWKEG